MWIAAQGDDRAAFEAVIIELTPALIRDAYGFVRPAQVEPLVQATWCQAWTARRTYRGDPQPLDWLHMVLCSVAANLAPANDTNDTNGRDELACLKSTSDLEAFLAANTVDDALDRLDHRQAMVIRRHKALGPDWPAIAREMHYPGPHQAKRAYRHAVRKLTALHAGQPAIKSLIT